MTFINIPVEWFSIGFNWTWMLLFGDIRQGIFYSMLLSFWIIFCGEHLMVPYNYSFCSVFWGFVCCVSCFSDAEACLSCACRIRLRGTVCRCTGSRSDPSSSDPSVSLFLTCVKGEAKGNVVLSAALLGHQMSPFECCFCCRGVQLTNPFYSIWATDVGTELAVSFFNLSGKNNLTSSLKSLVVFLGGL